MNTMNQILYWCEHTGRSYWEYVEQCEGPDIWKYLAEVWETMKEAIHRGLDAEGVLPGPLNLRRKASSYYIRAKGFKDSLRSRGLVFAYALAVSEENASGGKIVTAPTCGACGVVPAVLYHCRRAGNSVMHVSSEHWRLPVLWATSSSTMLPSQEPKQVARQKWE